MQFPYCNPGVAEKIKKAGDGGRRRRRRNIETIASEREGERGIKIKKAAQMGTATWLTDVTWVEWFGQGKREGNRERGLKCTKYSTYLKCVRLPSCLSCPLLPQLFLFTGRQIQQMPHGLTLRHIPFPPAAGEDLRYLFFKVIQVGQVGWILAPLSNSFIGRAARNLFYLKTRGIEFTSISKFVN